MSISRKNRFFFLLALLICWCSKDTETLHDTHCSTPCYTGPVYTLNIGECKAGTPICNDKDEIISCSNEVIPKLEKCNLKDDDCNGSIDDEPRGSSYCHLTLGICANTQQSCINGEWKECGPGDYGPDFQFEETRCDGLDNDCDGLTDEMPEPESPELCYEGSPGELWMPNSACRPGKTICRDGEIRCINQILPQIERCDGEDNDCDGFIDEEVSGQNIDILITLDRSGSMEMYYESVLDTVQTFANAFTEIDQFRFALIFIPGTTSSGAEDAYPQVISDFTDAENIVSIIETIPESSFGGSEGSFDVLWLAATGFIPLSWREDSIKFHILFTDEEGHTFLDALYDSDGDEIPDSCRNSLLECLPTTDCTISGVCCDTDGDNLADCSVLVERGVINAMLAAGHIGYIFTAVLGMLSFDDIATETGGEVLWLATETVMADQLFNMFAELCYETEE